MEYYIKNFITKTLAFSFLIVLSHSVFAQSDSITLKGGFEDSGNDELFNALAEYALKRGIEHLLNAEWEKQVASKTKPYKSYEDKIVVQKFEIDENNVLSFSIKQVYENNCYPSDANCEVKGTYSITKQEVALKNIKYIGKDGKVTLLTKDKKDVRLISKLYSLNGKLLKEDEHFDNGFQTYIFLANNVDFGNEFVKLMKKAGFTIERVAWYPN